jgi:choline dehydrogenase-like flavoprotein
MMHRTMQIAGGMAEGAARGKLSPAALAAAAEACMEHGPRPTFAAVGQCEAVVQAIQRHYQANVAPHLRQVRCLSSC